MFEHGMPVALTAGSKFKPLIENARDQEAVLGGNLDVIAYYTQAVCERETEHMPCIGPSVDRRILARTTEMAQNDRVKSLICFACAQVFTYVHAWDLGDAEKDHSVVRPTAESRRQHYAAAVPCLCNPYHTRICERTRWETA